jgi:hypothetical protein
MPTVVTTVTYNNFGRIAARLPVETGEIVEETCDDILTAIVVGMAGPKSGRVYGSHQASAPGEMPAVDLSNLINAVRTEMTAQTEGAVHTGDVEYSAHLEYGTVNMEARPFMTPAAEAHRQRFIDRMSHLEARIG